MGESGRGVQVKDYMGPSNSMGVFSIWLSTVYYACCATFVAKLDLCFANG